MKKLKNLSKGKRAILYAVSKGYKVNEAGEILNPEGKKLKGGITNTGYLHIKVAVGHILIHQLVAYQKYGDEYLYDERLVVRHLDGSPLNNSIENISIGTQKENMLDVPKEIRINKAKKANSGEALRKKKETFEKIKHSQGKNNSQYGTFWITNGKENKKWSKDKGEIPENFKRGRVLC